MSNEDKSNLPALNSPNYPTPNPIKEGITPKEVIIEDANQYHGILIQLHSAWNRPIKTVDQICKLALVTSKILTERRRMLLLPDRHVTPDSKTKSGFIPPLD